VVVDVVVDELLLDDEDEDDELLDEVELVGIEQPKVCSWPRRMGRAAGLFTYAACSGPHASFSACAGRPNPTPAATASAAATTAPRRVILCARVLKGSSAI
jgi:hypothetical protein